MTDQVFAREMSPGHWQWAGCDGQGDLQAAAYQSGDSEALASHIASNSSVSIVLRGQQVVATEVDLDSSQHKHAAKLIPYELEDELSASVDELHFAYAHRNDDATSVLYIDQTRCGEVINDISLQGCEVNTALPDYLLLQREDESVTLLLEAGILMVRLSEHWGFSVEQELAPLLLKRLAEQSALSQQPPEKLLLVADSEQEQQHLIALLPEAWQEAEQTIVTGGFWQVVDTGMSAASLNLRRGVFARQLPYAKWWSYWKLPTIVFLAAFACALVVNLAAYFGAKSAESEVREDINNVYLAAVPNGRLGDVEGILESKLKSVRQESADPSNVSFLLSKTVQALGPDSDATVTSYSYNGDQRNLQLTVEFESLDALATLRSALTDLGLDSDSPRTTSIGDGYQARIKLQEKP